MDFEGTPFLWVIAPWIFTFFMSLIQELRANETAMKNIWRIAVQQFALFMVDYFAEAAEFYTRRHETYDPGVSAERTEGRVILLDVPARIQECWNELLAARESMAQAIRTEGDKRAREVEAVSARDNLGSN